MTAAAASGTDPSAAEPPGAASLCLHQWHEMLGSKDKFDLPSTTGNCYADAAYIHKSSMKVRLRTSYILICKRCYILNAVKMHSLSHNRLVDRMYIQTAYITLKSLSPLHTLHRTASCTQIIKPYPCTEREPESKFRDSGCNAYAVI